MLVLSRQRDETIMIGDEIEVTVVDVRGDKVRLGINAPTRIAVHRKEVYEAIKRENEQAASLLENGSSTPSLGDLRALRGPGNRANGSIGKGLIKPENKNLLSQTARSAISLQPEQKSPSSPSDRG